jgi:hypothetical protein
MSYTESHTIQLSSLKATQKNNGTYLSDVNFSFQGLLKKNKNILSTRISVLHAQFPFTFYAINSNNNVIKYQIGTGTIYTSYIPYGNYNVTTLITALNYAFSLNNVIFNMTFSQITGLITFSSSSLFTFFQTDNSILPVLGFLNNNYTSVSNSLTGIYPLNVLGPLNFQIYSNQLITKNYNSVQGGQSTLLATIPIAVASWGLITYDNNTNIRNVLYNEVINNIDIQIFDNYGYLVNFNNSDWEITLILEIDYKQENNDIKELMTMLRVSASLQKEKTVESQEKNEQTVEEPNLDSTDMELYLLSQP